MAVVPSFALGLRAKNSTTSTRDTGYQRLIDRRSKSVRQLNELFDGNTPTQILALPNLSTLNPRYLAGAYVWYLESGRPEEVHPSLFTRETRQMAAFAEKTLNGREITDAGVYELITYAELMVKIMKQGEVTYLAPPEEEDEEVY